MKALAVNGSPKGESSNSNEILGMLRAAIPNAEWETLSSIREWRKPGSAEESLLASDAVVIAFPLYVDGIPSSLMALLERFAAALAAERDSAARGYPGSSGPPRGAVKTRRLYGAANCGFYEGAQNSVALELLSHFAGANGLTWCGGIGIGTGEMIARMKTVPPQASIRRPVTEAVARLARAVAAGESLEENLFVQHRFPRWLFKLMGEAGWRRWLRSNGGRTRDLHARPLTDGV